MRHTNRHITTKNHNKYLWIITFNWWLSPGNYSLITTNRQQPLASMKCMHSFLVRTSNDDGWSMVNHHHHHHRWESNIVIIWWFGNSETRCHDDIGHSWAIGPRATKTYGKSEKMFGSQAAALLTSPWHRVLAQKKGRNWVMATQRAAVSFWLMPSIQPSIQMKCRRHRECAQILFMNAALRFAILLGFYTMYRGGQL